MSLEKLKIAHDKYKEAEKEYEKVLKETKKELMEMGLTLEDESKLESYTIPKSITWTFPYPPIYPPYTITTTNTSTSDNIRLVL